MEAIAEIMSKIILARPNPSQALAMWQKANTERLSKTHDELLEMQCNHANSNIGDLNGYDCSVCKNKGIVFIVKNGEIKGKDCECMTYRRNMWRLEASGLSEFVSECTFDSYQTPEKWQKTVKSRAIEYLEKIKSDSHHWFFIGGAVGAGKTHISTAITYSLIQAGMSAKYMMYRDETTVLKGLVNLDPEKYSEQVKLLKSVDVLYIDDLFKMKKPKFAKDYEDCRPTNADIKLIFEIINARYCSKSKITIISSEHDTDTLVDIDEAIGSRIIQKCGTFKLNLSPDNKNYRLRE